MGVRLTKYLAPLAILAIASTASAAEYGKFDGYTLRVKLIGGAQYEPLYKLIPKWEAETGAKVEILSRKSHFELDREMKQDIALVALVIVYFPTIPVLPHNTVPCNASWIHCCRLKPLLLFLRW